MTKNAKTSAKASATNGAAEAANPFAAFSKNFAADPAGAAFAEFTKGFGDVKMPGFDVDAVIAMQQKNFEAVTAANKLAFDGFRNVFERQMQLAQESVNEAQAALNGKGKSADATQLDAARDAMERASGQMLELTEMARQSQGEVFEVLNKRFKDCAGEIRDQFPSA